jgi:mRNA-degrading endonuclease RelE of RelBE toxin-antitoxin system
MRVNIVWMEAVVSASALEEFTRLPRPIQTRVIQLVERLGRWPNVSGAKPLSGNLAGHFRLRTGDYRVQFRVDRGLVIVERIGHRDGFYDE